MTDSLTSPQQTGCSQKIDTVLAAGKKFKSDEDLLTDLYQKGRR